MSKNLQKAFYFFFWWNILLLFIGVPFLKIFVRFSFVFVLISVFYLFKEVFIKKLYKSGPIPSAYKFIMALLLLWVFINIFREPPVNPKGFIRFLGGRYYVAAWFPLLFFYVGSKIKVWSQIWHYAVKFNKLFVLASPVIIILFFSSFIAWRNLLFSVFLLPLLLLNWGLLRKNERVFLIIGFILSVFLTFAGGSRTFTLSLLFYLPVLYWLILIRNQKNRALKFVWMSVILSGVIMISYIVYNVGVSTYFSGNFSENVYKFQKRGFVNSREEYVYPAFFADMNTTKDWVLGRGLNGSYFTPIFVSVMKDVDPSNSLGIKPGYRVNIESGYLQTILKIGLIGLILELILALSAVYLGLFKSKNWFVKGLAFIIIGWLVSMFPFGLPEWSMSYMLFWLSIGACLSRETRMASSSKVFISRAKEIGKKNKSFFNPNHF